MAYIKLETAFPRRIYKMAVPIHLLTLQTLVSFFFPSLLCYAIAELAPITTFHEHKAMTLFIVLAGVVRNWRFTSPKFYWTRESCGVQRGHFNYIPRFLFSPYGSPLWGSGCIWR
ncbi:hypothetical protein SKAU_G00201970 [Synaphobranchus kaupii]|uniref:Uncharacterized protein n=1 Tax=Synaphobranchus kaupii TaxID=118154 RepID=A0A9Q1FG55_SYNKA|nr:hypothetical protein SKAU_G00201970 [Synaphobranchus kaupii]